MSLNRYTEGPASVDFNEDELITIWQYLTRIPTTENAEIRELIRVHLEDRKGLKLSQMSHVTDDVPQGGDAL